MADPARRSTDVAPSGDDPADARRSLSSRRSFLAGAGTAGLAATAGCLDAVPLFGSSRRRVEPEEPSEPREGTPGEFYTLVERNDVPVVSLYEDGSDLELAYRSGASDEDDSIEEMAVITTVYNENLVKNDADVGMLYGEIVNPFDGQAHGWGVKTEWLEQYNAGEMNEVALWMNITASRVYEEDLDE